MEIGYDNRNAFSDLSTISVFLYIYLLRILISCILWLVKLICLKESSCLIKLFKIVRKGIFFYILFKVMLEGIIEICICSYLNY